MLRHHAPFSLRFAISVNLWPKPRGSLGEVAGHDGRRHSLHRGMPANPADSQSPKPLAPSVDTDASGMVADVPRRKTRRTATWRSSSSTGTGGFAPVAAVCPIKKAKGVLASLMEEITAGQSYILQMHELDFTETNIEPMRAHVAALSRAYAKIMSLVDECVDNASAYNKEYKMIEDTQAWYENTGKHVCAMMITAHTCFPGQGADNN